jgi:hypothetical protein
MGWLERAAGRSQESCLGEASLLAGGFLGHFPAWPRARRMACPPSRFLEPLIQRFDPLRKPEFSSGSHASQSNLEVELGDLEILQI